jgi:hypothetical protein
MTARLSLLHSTSVEYFIGQLTLSSSVLFFLASSVTAPFEAKTWPGLVNRAEEDFSGRHHFFRMRVDSRLVGLLWKNVEGICVLVCQPRDARLESVGRSR